MARNTRMAQEAEEDNKKALAERKYVATQADWDSATGTEFGGQADILIAQIGEVVGPFEYVGHQPMLMEGGKTVTVHIGIDPEGDQVRLPIAASFLRAVDSADLQRGDKFLARRGEDTPKKSGIGKGQMMQIWAIKPTYRAPRVMPAVQAQAAA